MSLYYKLPFESFDCLRVLDDDDSSRYLVKIATPDGKCEIYVEHGLDEPDVVSLYLPGPEYEPELGGEVGQNNENQFEFGNQEEDVILEPIGGKRKRIVHSQSVDKSKEPEDSGNVSVYYDSDDPPTLEEEEENDDGEEVQSKVQKHKYPRFNPKSDPPALEIGLHFNDGRQFKNAMISYAVYTKRDIFWKKNQPNYVQTKCKGDGCPFYCSAGWDERSQGWQIKSINLEHICNCKFTLKIVSTAWLKIKFEDKVAEEPSIGYTEMKTYIKDSIKINVTKSMARRTVNGILKKLDAGFESQFKRVRDYAQECLNFNPGSTVKIKTYRVVEDSPCVFQRMYVCFGALKRGFLEGCRKVIGLDGCFLKSKLKGEILTAVGRDANNQMYPIAWAVVEIENNSSWSWFLELLKADLNIQECGEWTIMSDQQKGLANVIQQMFPGVEHRNCARHVHANWSKTHRGKVLKKHFWQCVKSTTESELAEQLSALEKRDVTARKDLDKYPYRFWCKAYFKTSVKCDIVDNNLCEAFNNTLLAARSKPIVPMLEEIRKVVMKRIAKKKASVERWNGDFGNFIMKKLDENITDCVDWEVDFNGDDGYEIKKGTRQYKVRLDNRTCSCRLWDLSGISCQHAICAIFDKKMQPEEFVDYCYNKEVYKRTYSHTIQPMNGEQFWPRTQYEEIKAPLPKKMSGRPKKKRILEVNEPKTTQSSTHLSRKGRVMTCSSCNQKGHNKRNCPTTSSQQSATSSTVRETTGKGNAGRGSAGRTNGGRGAAGRSNGGRGAARTRNVGIGIYTNPHTGDVTFNRGLPSERVLYTAPRPSDDGI